MKKLIIILTVFFTCLGVKAQDSTTDYIYSSDGFEVKKATFITSSGNERTCYGLYTKDGKTLVSAMENPNYFYVIDGCEVICSGAFQGVWGCYVYIPSSVKYIAPDAITARVGYGGTYEKYNRFGGIQDGVREDSNSGAAYAPTADPNAVEVARYNIQGIKLNEPTEGINIVQMSDGTAEKVLVK